jgi:erythronate-4-phosphate dehydrogenase
MKIVADKNIPFVREAFAEFGDVVLKAGREIGNADLRDADILLVRTVTRSR